MRLASLLLTILLMVGCGAEVKKPTAFIPPPPLPLSVYLYPRIAVAGSQVWVKCQLPSNVGDGAYAFGVSGVFHSEGEIDKIQHERLINVPCYNLVAYCAYQEYIPGKGLGPLKKTQITIEPAGDCRK